MKKISRILALLLIVIFAASCTGNTTFSIKNASSYKISDIICYTYDSSEHECEEIEIPSITAGGSSSVYMVTGTAAKVMVSFKFYIEETETFTERYYTIDKFVLWEGENTVITIDDNTYVHI
ncbi:MAG: hypothetical protein PHR20_07660 [Bacteroidales bacterium]|nr:hypothetical protein [Bacteroidales bacterium]